MSWNLPRVINNLEAEISTGYVKDPATKDLSMAGYDIRNANLIKTGDVETNTVFSVNDELEKLNNFEATTTNPDVTTIVGKLNIENIDTNTIYDLTELTRIELNDNEVNIITQNLTFNGQDVLTADNLETLENKTFYIDGSSISPLGTVFSEGIYADRYVVNGDQTIPKFLMSDGTLNDSGGFVVLNDFETPINSTVNVSPPDVGEVRFNNANNTLATTLWISHITHGANGVDIDVFLALITSVSIIYLQEADNSLNYIKYNVTTNPVIIENSYITLQVTQLSSGGSGASNFGNVDLIMSIFTNDTEIDGRITAVETKCQNITANGTINTIEKSSQFRLSTSNTFSITDDSDPFAATKFRVTNTQINAQIPMSMNTFKLNGISNPTNNDDCVNKLYVDNVTSSINNDVTALETRTLNQDGNSGGTTFQKNMTLILRAFDGDIFEIRNDDIPSSVIKLRVSNTSVQINSVPLFMQGQRIQDVGAPTDTSDVASIGTLKAGSVPYFTSTNRLSGATKNLFVELGNSTIQSAINVISTGGSIQISSGGSTENIICSGQNYTLTGALCPSFTQTTQITGNLTIGSSGFVSTRVRVSHMKFVGNLIFDNSTNQQLRTYFYNCDWNGTVTFPTSLATGTSGTSIYFIDCSFSGSSTITIPNQNLYTIFFTRCSFIGQTITNNQVVGNSTKTVFSDCSGLPTLTTLGFCVLNGLNGTLTGTQGNFSSVVLGGISGSLLKGNGSLLFGAGFVKGDATLDNSAYTTIISGTFTATFGSVVNAVFTYKYIFDGTSKIVTLGIPHIRSTITGGPLALLSSTTNALPAVIRPATESVSSIRILVANVFEAGYIILASTGLISFSRVSASWANNANGNGSGNSAPGDYMYITYVV